MLYVGSGYNMVMVLKRSGLVHCSLDYSTTITIVPILLFCVEGIRSIRMAIIPAVLNNGNYCTRSMQMYVCIWRLNFCPLKTCAALSGHFTLLDM